MASGSAVQSGICTFDEALLIGDGRLYRRVHAADSNSRRYPLTAR